MQCLKCYRVTSPELSGMTTETDSLVQANQKIAVTDIMSAVSI